MPDNDVSPLPNGWAWTTLGESVEILDSQRVPINATERSARIEGKSKSELYPYFGATGQVGWIDDYLFDDELILLGEDGAPFLEALKAKAYLIRGKSWVNNHAHVLRASAGLMQNSYLLHYLNTFDYHEYVTGTTRLKLNQGRMRRIPIPLAPLPEQHRIVEAIETQFTRLDAAVAALERAKANLARYKASVLKAACEGRLVPIEAALQRRRAGITDAIVPRKGEAFRPTPSNAMATRNAKSPCQPEPNAECLAPTATPYDMDAEYRVPTATQHDTDAECPTRTSYEPAAVLLERILAERRARWEAEQWEKEIARAKKKAAQAARKAKGLPTRIRDLADGEWVDLPEDVYGKYLPKNDKWKQKYKAPEAPDTSELPDLPEGWCWARFDSLLRESLKNGHSAKASQTNEGIRTLTLTAVTLGDFSIDNTKLTIAEPTKVKDLWIQPGDLFIERSNTPELVGTSRLYRGKPNFAIFPDLLIRARVVGRISEHYIEITLKSKPTRLYFRRSAQGISGTMPKINQNTVRELAVPLPPLAEQHRIVEEVERRLSVAAEVEASLDANLVRAARLRQAILKRAFEGRLVPQNPGGPDGPGDEPASVLLERIGVRARHSS